MKLLRCRDVGLECDFIARGETEADVLAQAAQHAREDHGLSRIPDELVMKALSCVRDE